MLLKEQWKNSDHNSSDTMDTQASKSAAAASFDYENDPRWADYWGNILIPPNMAARPDVVNHFKRKFYQRYIVCTSILPPPFYL